MIVKMTKNSRDIYNNSNKITYPLTKHHQKLSKIKKIKISKNKFKLKISKISLYRKVLHIRTKTYNIRWMFKKELNRKNLCNIQKLA